MIEAVQGQAVAEAHNQNACRVPEATQIGYTDVELNSVGMYSMLLLPMNELGYQKLMRFGGRRILCINFFMHAHALRRLPGWTDGALTLRVFVHASEDGNPNNIRILGLQLDKYVAPRDSQGMRAAGAWADALTNLPLLVEHMGQVGAGVCAWTCNRQEDCVFIAMGQGCESRG
jgi:hypothetical protein